MQRETRSSPHLSYAWTLPTTQPFSPEIVCPVLPGPEILSVIPVTTKLRPCGNLQLYDPVHFELEMSMERCLRVAVVGSGLAGLTTAYLLRREGCQVYLIEKV
jgi:hypothetical protein